MITANTLFNKKQNGEPIVAITAYDYNTAKIVDDEGVDLVLVGDSLGMVIYGYDSTVKVTMADMRRHTVAVRNGVTRALLITDMPFMSYQRSTSLALRNAASLIRHGANGVKVEGASSEVLNNIKAMTESGILVVGHIGFTPQHVNALGGNKVQGKSDQDAAKLKKEADDLEAAGVQSLVLELVPESVAESITKSLSIPTIGIGAGRYVDGQILVVNDVLGVDPSFRPKFIKRYADFDKQIRSAVSSYRDEVAHHQFPSKEHCF